MLGPFVAGIEFEVVTYSCAELLAAKDALTERSRALFAANDAGVDDAIGWGPSIPLNRVNISLSDINAAGDLARRLDVPPPADIYCIDPYESERGHSLDEPTTMNAPSADG